MLRTIAVVLAAASLPACAASRAAPLSTVSLSTQVDIPALESDYRISAQDILNVRVFQVEDLSFDELRVGTSGLVELPLIGSVRAAGRTPSELAAEIRDRLANRYMHDPQVTVSVTESSSQKITVDGAVTEAGVFEMKGRTTLQQAVAMAKGATRTADLRNVAVFRTVDDQRTVAVFDLIAIRMGEAPDPVLMGDDIVVVDTSQMSVLLREALAALPGLAVFRSY
ncbi:polysaccharide biosynthesis/export family protein [Brevundimonas viscosa]|uniref:Polysaccharide export outer membrane protein n=1 Tax=Brevundimonas viscosa TaxID=871741 RepID=A0A1I6NPI2_9CAUL|nr:polysaccharide biosynthesis/export family protein [Brevundimonas viscosa]SFS29876.1 polysaccharide export outer membrane protein [Brevundimonas viscosa]